MIIIKRKETRIIKESKRWVLLYGRRKTGKTFLVKNFIKFDEYFFVKRDKTIINGKTISYETFTELLKEQLNNEKTIVIDEFNRLEDDFLDFLHSVGNKGRLILLSSALHLSRKIISANSPLLGLLAEVQLGLISLDSCFKDIYKLGFNKKESLELAVFCREPITIEYIKKGKKAIDIITDILLTTKNTVPAMIGEVFIEEKKQLSKVYEGIVRAVSIGRNKAGEITNHLFSKKLIKKESSTMIQQYLKNLIDFGILKRILIFNKKDYHYDLVSPLMKLYFYADEKYNFSEEASEEKAKLILSNMVPKLIEANVREFLAYKHGLAESMISDKDKEIDICLLKFKKPFLIGEVKWGEIKDINKLKEKLEPFKNSFIFVPDRSKLDKNLYKDMLDFL